MSRLTLSLAVAWLFLVVLLLAHPIDDVDVFWQIKLGQLALENRALVTTDPFTYTHHGEAVPPFSWLWQILFATLYDLGSWNAVRMVHALCVATAYLVAARTGFSDEQRGIGSAIGMVLGIGAGMAQANVRPQGVGLLFFALFLWLVRHEGRLLLRLFAAAVLVIVWQNLHPSALVALAPVAALVVAALGQKRRALGLAAFLLVVVICSWATPLGRADAHWSPLNIEISRNLLGVTEWLPPWSAEVRGVMQPFWLGLGIALVCLLRLRTRVRLDDFLLCIAMTTLACTACRFALFWSIVMVPIWGRWIDRAIPESWQFDLAAAKLGSVIGWATLSTVGVAAFGIGLLLPMRFGPEIPRAGVDKLRELLPEGRIYNYREWSGPMLLDGRPEWQLAIDGRLYLFTDREWVDYQMAALGHVPLNRIVSKHRPDAFFLRPSYHRGLIAQLRDSPDWREAYQDEMTIIFLPRNANK